MTCARLLAGCMIASIAMQAHARVAMLEVERITLPIGRLDAVVVQLDWPDTAATGELRLDAKALDAGDLGYRYRDVRWQCNLKRHDDGRLSCKGTVRARGGSKGTLAIEWKDGALDLELTAAKGEFGANFGAEPAPIVLRASDLPAAWLQPLLTRSWPQGRVTDGRIDATLTFGKTPQQGVWMRGPVAFTALGLDSENGRVAAAALDATGSLEMAFDAESTGVALDLKFAGGEILAGSLYASLPETPVDFGLTMRSTPASRWTLERFGWRDPGVLELEATGVLDPSAATAVATLDASAKIPSLDAANRRYFETPLGTVGLKGLAVDGSANASFAVRAGTIDAVDVDLQKVDARDGAERFALSALDGTLRWRNAGTVDSELRWDGARLHAVDLGAARLALRSENGGVELREGITIDLLGGQLAMPRFAWRPARENSNATLDVSASLRNLEMAQLGRALGWPEFAGRLSGDIPAVRYADEVLSFEGGLGVDVFGGRVDIAELTLERPLGVAPTMTAQIAFENLDLKPLTGVFGFGEITGRLDGHVKDLRLVDWAPVAFDADLHTSTTAKDKRRISQRAVQDLSSVGGAGVVAGLQAQVLKLFETFPYDRIGLKCRLANNVCEMAGVDSSGNGYTIVQGSGLPRITVVGHQRKVDWPVLVARLKAATEGQTPIVD